MGDDGARVRWRRLHTISLAPRDLDRVSSAISIALGPLLGAPFFVEAFETTGISPATLQSPCYGGNDGHPLRDGLGEFQ